MIYNDQLEPLSGSDPLTQDASAEPTVMMSYGTPTARRPRPAEGHLAVRKKSSRRASATFILSSTDLLVLCPQVTGVDRVRVVGHVVLLPVSLLLHLKAAALLCGQLHWV